MSQPLPEDLEALKPHVRDLLRMVLDREVRLAAVEVVNQRRDYRVLIARLSQPETMVVVKLAGPDAPYPTPFERTAAIHALAAAQPGLPVPRVLAANTRCAHFPWRYMVKAYAPGQQWVDVMPGLAPDQHEDVYARLGSVVAALHGIRFEGFGELGDDGRLMTPVSLHEALAQRARVFIHDAALREDFLRILAERRALFAGVERACLVHEDLHGYNIVLDEEPSGWEISAVLDFDKAWAGHAEIDLARLELWTGMTAPAFWEAYRAVHAVDPGYARRKLVYQLQWCYEFPHKHAQHVALTDRVRRAVTS